MENYPKTLFMADSVKTPEYKRLLLILTEARKGIGLSQREFSRKIGMYDTYCEKIENGRRRLDLIELMQYCKGLNLDPASLIKDLS